MKHVFFVWAIILSILSPFWISCSEEDVADTTPFLEISAKTLNFEERAAESEVTVKTNVEWNCKVQDDGQNWCHVTRSNGKLILSVDENDEQGVRTTSVEVVAATLKETITVSQLGWGKAILLSSAAETISAVGGELEVKVTTNIEYDVVLEEGMDWVRRKTDVSRAEHPVVTTNVDFVVEPNAAEERKTTVTFKDKEENSEFEPVLFSIVQKSVEDYTPDGTDEIKDDILVKIIGGKASSFQSGENIEKSFDGDKGTIYHSSWNNKGDNYFPITLEYYFEEGSDMDYLVYYPRTTGSNGLFKVVDIEAKTNANTRGTDEWEMVLENYDFGGSSSAKRVDFPKALIGVSAVRITVKSGAGDGQGFASCAEMEFYKKNPENFDYTALFTDPSCSELKPGISEQDILACPYSFFKNIAYYMFHKKYPREFRIASFKAYPHPDTQAKENKTSQYGLLDNVTGISVSAGDELVVMAGNIGNQSLSLCVQNLDVPGGDGFGGDKYPLVEGVNKLKMDHKGLVYVMYHTPDYESAPVVKLHFATGKVNGYFDSQNPYHKGRWKELLSNAVDKYFDVVGKYAHLTFPTERFKSYTKDLSALINTYDEIVYNEQELLGLVKYNKVFKNRMYFNVMYTSYMYSTSYHTAYNDETLPELCDNERLRTSACWGPAHEVGHSNQTRPGVKWLGTTEVTNNIMSEYIQTTIFNQPSRVQTESMGDEVSPNRYSKAWNNIMVEKTSHAVNDDVFCKLIPFWQLELYFGKVLGRTPLQQSDKGGFYPDVYEYVRTHADLSNAGEQQLEFVYIASKVAGMNLLDFFEKWGFLKEVDVELDDYGKGRLKITRAQADALRSRVQGLGLQEPDMPIEYITDNNYTVFKEKKNIEKGTANRISSTLKMENWKNVVVYEVRENNENGRLICVSDGMLEQSSTASFSVKGGWLDTYKVYAVSYDNRRVEVDL